MDMISSSQSSQPAQLHPALSHVKCRLLRELHDPGHIRLHGWATEPAPHRRLDGVPDPYPGTAHPVPSVRRRRIVVDHEGLAEYLIRPGQGQLDVRVEYLVPDAPGVVLLGRYVDTRSFSREITCRAPEGVLRVAVLLVLASGTHAERIELVSRALAPLRPVVEVSAWFEVVDIPPMLFGIIDTAIDVIEFSKHCCLPVRVLFSLSEHYFSGQWKHESGHSHSGRSRISNICTNPWFSVGLGDDYGSANDAVGAEEGHVEVDMNPEVKIQQRTGVQKSEFSTKISN